MVLQHLKTTVNLSLSLGWSIQFAVCATGLLSKVKLHLNQPEGHLSVTQHFKWYQVPMTDIFAFLNFKLLKYYIIFLIPLKNALS